VLDERLVRFLHVRALRADELHAEREPHVLFQASTIGALLDGAYDGEGHVPVSPSSPSMETSGSGR
jgi:hypothetical protein